MVHRRVTANSFEVAVCALLILYGAVGLTTGAPLLIALGVVLFSWGLVWYAVVAAGAVTVLVAMFWPSAVTALLIERVGLAVLAWQLAFMGLLVQFTNVLVVRVDGVGCVLLAAGSIGRIVRITADLRELRDAART